MAKPFDIAMVGDKALKAAFEALPGDLQKRVGRAALRKSAERAKVAVLLNLSGRKVDEQTGRLVNAFENTSVKTQRRGPVILAALPLPTRDKLNIPPTDKTYYPTAVEYGHKLVRGGKAVGRVPAHPYMRPAVDENRERELRLIGRDIGKGIEKAARKRAKGKK